MWQTLYLILFWMPHKHLKHIMSKTAHSFLFKLLLSLLILVKSIQLPSCSAKDSRIYLYIFLLTFPTCLINFWVLNSIQVYPLLSISIVTISVQTIIISHLDCYNASGFSCIHSYLIPIHPLYSNLILIIKCPCLKLLNDCPLLLW